MPPTSKPLNPGRPVPANPPVKPIAPPKTVVVKLVDAPTDQGLQNTGNYVLALLIFITYSRVLDLNSTIASFRFPLMLSVIVLAIAFMSGSVLDRIGTTGRCLLGFTVWVVVGAPFGFYRSQSLQTVIEMVKAILIFTACASLITTVRQSRRVMLAVGLASLVGSVMSSFLGQLRGGRLTLEQGSFGDPNAYAMFLLLGLPIWWYFARRSSTYAVKLICWGCTIPILVAFGKTGSRGGMAAFAALLLMIFLQSSVMKKLQIIIAGVLLLGALYATLPPYLKVRYFILFSPKEAAQPEGELADRLEADAGSSEARYKLLMDSLVTTLKNPIFGVGAGNFAHYVDAEARKRGGRTGYQPTHNSYTEISSEAGLPALILFIAALVFTFRKMAFVLKAKPPTGSKNWEDLTHAVRYLRMSLVSTMVCCFFLNYAYKGIFQPLLGIITGVTTVAIGELMRAKAAAEKEGNEAKAASGAGPAAGPGGKPGPGGARPGPRAPLRGPWPAPGRA